MVKRTFLPALLVAGLTLAPLATFAQATAPAGEEQATPGAPGQRGARSPMIRLDFGAGRTISVQCGETAISACVEAITPLAEKLAAMPAAGPEKHRTEGKGHHKKHGAKHDKAHKKGDWSKHGAGQRPDRKPGTGDGGAAEAPPAGQPDAAE